MIELPMSGLRRRVLVSRERVKFAHADPYGHLASGAYVDMIMSHRVEALEDLVGFSILRYAGSGFVFPARDVSISYARPAFVGDLLEVASWIEELGPSSFDLRAVVAGSADRQVRATAMIQFVTADARTGKRLPSPETLPSSRESSPLADLPTSLDYMATLVGLPAQWTGPVMETSG